MDGSGVERHILKMQCYSRDNKGVFQRDQDRTGTESYKGRPYTAEFQKMARDYEE